MRRQSCIQHAPESRFVALRSDYVKVCESFTGTQFDAKDPRCAALILDVFVGWTDHHIARIKDGIAPKYGMWTFMSVRQLSDQLLSVYGDKKLRKHLNALMEQGLLERRVNPDNPQDNSYQYLLNIQKLQSLIDQIGADTPVVKTPNPSVKRPNPVVKTPNPLGQKTTTIPKTTKTTNKTKKEYLPAGADGGVNSETLNSSSSVEENHEQPETTFQSPAGNESIPQNITPVTPSKTADWHKVAVETFGVTGGSIISQLTGKAKKGTRADFPIEPPVTEVEEIKAFGLWWKSKYPDANVPTSAEKVKEWFEGFRLADDYEVAILRALEELYDKPLESKPTPSPRPVEVDIPEEATADYVWDEIDAGMDELIAFIGGDS